MAAHVVAGLAGTAVVAGILIYRTLAVVAYSPKSYILFGAKKAEPVAKLLASSSSSSDSETLQIDIKTSDYTLTGTVNRAYTSVLDVFVGNVFAGHELGASFCLHVKGKRVVDIAGGRKHDGKDYDLGSGAFLLGF